MNKIFEAYGIEIHEQDGRYVLRYDNGEMVSRIEEIEISESDAIRAQQNSEEAYHVILENQ